MLRDTATGLSPYAANDEDHGAWLIQMRLLAVLIVELVLAVACGIVAGALYWRRTG